MILLTLLILILCVLLLGLPLNGAFPWFWLLALCALLVAVGIFRALTLPIKISIKTVMIDNTLAVKSVSIYDLNQKQVDKK